MTNILLYDPRPDVAGGQRLAESLSGDGHRVRSFSDRARFLEAAVAGPAQFVVYALCPDCDADLDVLRVLRRVQPDVRLIVLSQEPTLEQQFALQPLRPLFYSVEPPDSMEVVEVVRAVLHRHERAS